MKKQLELLTLKILSREVEIPARREQLQDRREQDRQYERSVEAVKARTWSL